MQYLLSDTAVTGDYAQFLLKQIFPQHQSLFKGTKDEMLSSVAPYLFLINDNPEKKLKEHHGTQLTNYIVVETHVPIHALVDYFQKQIYITKGEKKYYFRCWDPRVLRRFLFDCNKAQLKEFFGPVEKFICEDEDTNFVLEFTLVSSQLNTRRIPAQEFFNSIPQTLKPPSVSQGETMNTPFTVDRETLIKKQDNGLEKQRWGKF